MFFLIAAIFLLFLVFENPVIISLKLFISKLVEYTLDVLSSDPG